MEKKSDKINSDDWLKDIPLRSESEGYQDAEMVACKRCQRKNPPTRLDCLYCGVELEFDETQSQLIKPVLRKAEAHLNGLNLIYLANLKSWDESQISEVAKMTRIAIEDLRRLVESGKALPLARTETDKEVKIVSERLNEFGIDTKIIKDEVFETEKPSRRLRRLEFQGDKLVLILFNNDEVYELKREDLAFIIVGGLFEKTLESTEKHKKKGENKILETAEISSDEILIDIYSKEDLISFRVSQKGFDFSCLGGEKDILAVENMKVLIAKLREFAPNAKFDNEYLMVRDCLTDIWEVEEKSDSKGMKRQSFGSFNRLTEVKTSNLLQFNKYSRLQWLLASEQLMQKGEVI